MRMAPLAWVEDRPVYAGDVLYNHNGVAVERVIAGFWQDNKNRLRSTDGKWDEISWLTWTPPRKPLCEVEGKPVYEGDTLYSSFFAKAGDMPDGGKFVVTGVSYYNGNTYLEAGQVSSHHNTRADCCTWKQPPVMVKRVGFMNCYPNVAENCIHMTEEVANRRKSPSCFATVRIEWEEPAKP